MLEGLAPFVDFPTVSDGVDDNRVFGLQDFKDDAMRAFAEFVQSFELALQREQFCGIEIRGEPLKSIDNTLGNGSIELFKLFGSRLEESNGVQLETEVFADGSKTPSPITLCNGFLLAKKPIAQVLFHREALVGIPKHLNEFLLDHTRNNLSKFLLAHLGNGAGHTSFSSDSRYSFGWTFSIMADCGTEARGTGA